MLEPCTRRHEALSGVMNVSPRQARYQPYSWSFPNLSNGIDYHEVEGNPSIYT